MKIKILLAAVLGLMSSFFCSATDNADPLVVEFTTFVESVEANGNSYTKEQWDEANKTFDDLVSRFKKQKNSLSKEDKDAIHDLTGRYKAAVTNSGVDSAIKGMSKTYNSVASATTDAYNETASFFNNLFKKKDSDSKDSKKEADKK